MRILVIGDCMADVYSYGNVDRVAPDFTGFVFDKQWSQTFLGGAGNVALNIQSLLPNHEVHLLGSLAREHESLLGEHLIFHRVQDITMIKERLVTVGDDTPDKSRHKQKLIRIDNFQRFSAPAGRMPYEDFDVVVYSDYNKGTVEKYMGSGRRMTFVDSRRRDVSMFGSADCLKINHQEYETCKRSITNPTCVVTQGRKPVKLFRLNQLVKEFPSYPIEVLDTQDVDFCGAGDSFLAGLVYGFVHNMTLEESIPVANVVAAIAVSKFGTAVVGIQELKKEMLKSVPDRGVETRSTIV